MRFHVSWVFRCLRWSYLKYSHPERENFPIKYIEAGKWAEKIVYDRLKKYHLKKGRNRRLFLKNFTLIGRPDFILKGKVIEVKRSRLIHKDPAWIAQLNLYLLMESSSKGFLFEVGTNKVRVSKHPFSSKLARKSLNYFGKLEKSIKEGKIPKVNGFNCRYCRYCSYRFYCNALESKYCETFESNPESKLDLLSNSGSISNKKRETMVAKGKKEEEKSIHHNIKKGFIADEDKTSLNMKY